MKHIKEERGREGSLKQINVNLDAIRAFPL